MMILFCLENLNTSEFSQAANLYQMFSLLGESHRSLRIYWVNVSRRTVGDQ